MASRLLVLLSCTMLAFAIECGTIATDCFYNGGTPYYMRQTYSFESNIQGEIKQLTVRKSYYGNTDCSGNVVLSFIEKANINSMTTIPDFEIFDITLNDVLIRTDDNSYMSQLGISCSSDLGNGKEYSLSGTSCTVNGVPYTTEYQGLIGHSIQYRLNQTNNENHILPGNYHYSYLSSEGCDHTIPIIIGVAIGVVALIIIIIVLVIVFKRK